MTPGEWCAVQVALLDKVGITHMNLINASAKSKVENEPATDSSSTYDKNLVVLLKIEFFLSVV